MSEITYECDACGQTFTDEDNLKKHMIDNHTSKTEKKLPGEEK